MSFVTAFCIWMLSLSILVLAFWLSRNSRDIRKLEHEIWLMGHAPEMREEVERIYKELGWKDKRYG